MALPAHLSHHVHDRLVSRVPVVIFNIWHSIITSCGYGRAPCVRRGLGITRSFGPVTDWGTTICMRTMGANRETPGSNGGDADSVVRRWTRLRRTQLPGYRLTWRRATGGCRVGNVLGRGNGEEHHQQTLASSAPFPVRLAYHWIHGQHVRWSSSRTKERSVSVRAGKRQHALLDKGRGAEPGRQVHSADDNAARGRLLFEMSGRTFCRSSR